MAPALVDCCCVEDDDDALEARVSAGGRLGFRLIFFVLESYFFSPKLFFRVVAISDLMRKSSLPTCKTMLFHRHRATHSPKKSILAAWKNRICSGDALTYITLSHSPISVYIFINIIIGLFS